MTSLFDKQKADCFSKIDLSRKGSIDLPIVEVIQYINNHKNYFSLSSCSGRIVVFAEGVVAVNQPPGVAVGDGEQSERVLEKEAGPLDDQLVGDRDSKFQIVKAGCDWIHVSHTLVDAEEVFSQIRAREGRPGCVVIKFEPFILHVQCRDIDAAKLVHTAAVESGYRNSGITLGRAGKVVAAVRSTHGLEVPISDEEGNLLVTKEFVTFILNKANSKLEENFDRLKKFEEKIHAYLNQKEQIDKKRRKNGAVKAENQSRGSKAVGKIKEDTKPSSECSLDGLEGLFF